MSDIKVHYVFIVLERKHISQDSKGRVRLPQLRKILEVKKIKKAFKRFFRKVMILAFKLLASAAITLPFAIWAIEDAYIERGYKAYGGEYLFIAMFFYLVYHAVFFLLKE